MIVFTSDHGDFMGDHQLMLKGAYAYQGLIRVPFIWVEPDAQAPRRRARRAARHARHRRDLPRSRRLAPYNGIQGKSLLPALDGDDGAGHDGILIEYGSQRPVPALPPECRMRTLVDERWRITLYRSVPWGELYDLAADPHELHNLWDEPASAGIRHELTERLVQKMMEHGGAQPKAHAYGVTSLRFAPAHHCRVPGVVPAKAGTQCQTPIVQIDPDFQQESCPGVLGPRFRGDDDKEV